MTDEPVSPPRRRAPLSQAHRDAISAGRRSGKMAGPNAAFFERNKRILELYASGMTMSEVAVTLGTTKGTVAGIVHRGRKKDANNP